MIRISSILAACTLVGMLSACTPLPYYRAPLGTTFADVQLSHNMRKGRMTMCVGGKCYAYRPVNGHLNVPIGQRVALLRYFSSGGGRVTYSCYPGMSFVPDMHHAYYADFGMRDNRCRLLIFRMDHSKRVGIALDPTARALQGH